MADTINSPVQVYPDSKVLTSVLTTTKASVVSTVFACNQSTTKTTVRVSVAKNGEADARKHYLYYDTEVPANDSLAFTVGVTLAIGDVIRVYSDNGMVSFNVFYLGVS